MVAELKTRVARVADLLNRYGVRYVVVGAEACNVHGLVRGTKDVDILLEKTQANVEKALEALSELPYHLAREILPEEVLRKPFTIIGDDPRVDLLLAAGKIKFADIGDDIFWASIEGIKIPFAGIDSLIRSKSTDRTKDHADLEALQSIKQKAKIAG